MSKTEILSLLPVLLREGRHSPEVGRTCFTPTTDLQGIFADNVY